MLRRTLNYFCGCTHQECQVSAVEYKFDLILDKLEAIMATIADLQAAVARETEVENSVVTLLEGISQQLKDAKANGDPAALDAVIASIDANTAKLSAAVTANTPAA